MARLAELGHRAAIVGHKGAGKTSLLDALVPRYAGLGYCVHRLRLDRAKPALGATALIELDALGHDSLVLLDGAEQLGWFAWRRFERASRRAGGLIITAHTAGRLPTALRCETSPRLLVDLVEQLAPGTYAEAELKTVYEQARGNLRDALWALYDRHATREASPGRIALAASVFAEVATRAS